MNDTRELVLTLESHIPIITIESHDEQRVRHLFAEVAVHLNKPVFSWSMTEGMTRMDHGDSFSAQSHTKDPEAMLGQIKASTTPGVYVLMDFHPFIDEPLHTRLLKEIALNYHTISHTVVLVSHQLSVPNELKRLTASYEVALPTLDQLDRIVRDAANDWAKAHPGKKVQTDSATLDLLIRNLQGLSMNDARRLARKAIVDDGKITKEDLPRISKAKYDMLDMEGVLSFEYDTAQFSDVGGLKRLKRWLDQRKMAFHGEAQGLDAPKGIMLLGVQGGGKSLAAKAVSGSWGIPLLRLDFGALYNE